MLTKIQGLLSYQWYKPTNETFHKAYLKIAATIIIIAKSWINNCDDARGGGSTTRFVESKITSSLVYYNTDNLITCWFAYALVKKRNFGKFSIIKK